MLMIRRNNVEIISSDWHFSLFTELKVKSGHILYVLRLNDDIGLCEQHMADINPTHIQWGVWFLARYANQNLQNVLLVHNKYDIHTHWRRINMTAIWQTTFSKAFLGQIMFVFWSTFYWNIFLILYKSALVQIITWFLTGDKLLHESILIKFYVYVWRHWVTLN